MKKLSYLSIATILSVLVFAGCSDNDDDNTIVTPDDELVKVLVVNEGSLGSSNSTISAIMVDNTVKSDIYYDINKKRLGSIGQGLFALGEDFYLTVNGSNKIEVLDGESFEVEDVITCATPYSICLIDSNNKLAAVSGQVSNKIYLLNYEENEIYKEISTAGAAYEMAFVSNRLFFITAEWTEDGFESGLYFTPISNIETSSIRRVDDIEPLERTKLIVDSEYYLWIFTRDSLVRMNPSSLEIERTLAFEDIEEDGYYPNEYSSRLSVNPAGDRLYFNLEKENGSTTETYIASISTTAPGWNDAIIFKTDVTNYLYNLAYSPYHTIFVTETDYSSNGRVYEYSVQGVRQNSYTVGVNPFFLYFINR
ncbi:MAG: hypothetical protein LIO79_07365 [Rikenellaceae bacterium]|nr:hypothetical protein [Rikenellaceae bacterium]